MIIVVSISILLISGVVLVIRKISPSFKVCPICAGVSGTWFWMLIASYSGYPVDLAIVGLLMGGSVVGMAYQLERKIRVNKVLAWKILFIPAGFVGAYSLIYFSGLVLVIFSAFIYFLLNVFIEDFRIIGANKNRTTKVTCLEEKMKNCC